MSKRPLTFFDVTCIGVNAIVGSSIFLFPGTLAAMLGPASIVSFAATALLLAPVALCFAQASSRQEAHGGPYLYARDAFGPTVGFAVGWLCWLTQVVSWAAVANGLAPYLAYFLPVFERPAAAKAAAAGVIAVMAAINLKGVKPGAWTADAFTLAKLVPLVALIAFGLPRADFGALTPFAPHGWAPMGGACLLAYFAFQGFEVVPVPAGEVEDAKSVVPRAVVGALALAALIYLLVQLVAVCVEPNLAGAERPLALVAGRLMGPAGAALLSGGAVVSMLGFNAGCALGGPRYLVALGERGDLPAAAASVRAAIVVTAALSLAAALLLDFQKLVDAANVVVTAQYLSTCAAVFASGRMRPVAALGIAATLWLGAQMKGADLAWAGAMLAAGFVLRAALRSRSA